MNINPKTLTETFITVCVHIHVWSYNLKHMHVIGLYTLLINNIDKIPVLVWHFHTQMFHMVQLFLVEIH